MDSMRFVPTYRFTVGLSERLRLTKEIIRLIAPDLRVFVFGSIREPVAQFDSVHRGAMGPAFSPCRYQRLDTWGGGPRLV